MTAGIVDEEIRRRFVGVTLGSGTLRMNAALSELPDSTCPPSQEGDGGSRKAVIEMLIPSRIDPSVAPEGQHVTSLFAQHVAPHLAPSTRRAIVFLHRGMGGVRGSGGGDRGLLCAEIFVVRAGTPAALAARSGVEIGLGGPRFVSWPDDPR